MNNNRPLKNSFFIKFFFNSKFIFVIALVVLLTLSFPIIKNFSQRNKAAVEIKELEAEIESMNKKNGELRQLMDYLNSDRYLEEQARLNFGLKKPGEETAVIEMEGEREDGNKKSIYDIPGLEKIENPKPLSNPEKWLKYFFKKD